MPNRFIGAEERCRVSEKLPTQQKCARNCCVATMHSPTPEAFENIIIIT